MPANTNCRNCDFFLKFHKSKAQTLFLFPEKDSKCYPFSRTAKKKLITDCYFSNLRKQLLDSYKRKLGEINRKYVLLLRLEGRGVLERGAIFEIGLERGAQKKK